MTSEEQKSLSGMSLEDICCDRNLSEKLVELGWTKPTLFHWVEARNKVNDAASPIIKVMWDDCEGDCFNWRYKDGIKVLGPAHCVAEMGEMFPSCVVGEEDYTQAMPYFSKDIEFTDETQTKFVDVFTVEYEDHYDVKDKKEANARALYLIWLIKNGHLDLGDLK